MLLKKLPKNSKSLNKKKQNKLEFKLYKKLPLRKKLKKLRLLPKLPPNKKSKKLKNCKPRRKKKKN